MAHGQARGGALISAEGQERRPATRFLPAELAARLGIHYGWVVVGVVFLVVVLGAAVRSAPGVLIRPLEAEFGWNRGAISLALAVGLLTYGLGAPLSGMLADRFGIRGTTAAFILVSTIGVAFSAFVSHLWQMHLWWGVVVGVGTGGMAIVIGAAVASQWFAARRGLVTGLLGGAASAGHLIFLPLLAWITAQWGWRPAVGLLAVLLGVVIFPTALLLLRNRPRDVGLEPYGAGHAAVLAAGPDGPSTSLGRAVRTGDFWLLALSYGVCGFTTMGLVGTHFIPHAAEHGFSETQAAGILSLMGGLNVIGTTTSGWLCDRISPRKLLAGYFLLRAAALSLLPFVSSVPLMSLFAIMFGLDYIATVPPTIMLAAERFGRRSLGSIFGWITCVHMCGAALAAALAGQIHDIVGDYTIAIYLSGLLALIAAGLAFSVRPRRADAPRPALSAAGD